MRNKATPSLGVNGEGASGVNPHPSTIPQSATNLADDVLVGAEDIAVFLYGPDEGLKETNLRRVYHGIARGDIPTFKIGGKRHARKSTILQRIAGEERTA